MYVQTHDFFERFMHGLAVEPEASVVHSLALSPNLGAFLADIDPALSLDWSGESFQGLPLLRERVLASTETDRACTVDDVLIAAGTAEANFLSICQLVQPGDELIVDVPGWPQPLVLGEAIGATVKRLPRYEERAWRFDMDELADMITPKTRLIFLCNPSNPTGQVMREDELKQIVALAERVGAYVLCDEVYAGLEWDDAPIPRIANLYERGITTGSVSKALGLQGLRTGWLICRDPKLIKDALVLREDSSEIMNIMGEVIAEVALRPDRYAAAIAQAKEVGRTNLDMLNDFIQRRPELSWQRPVAGLIGFARLHMEMGSEELADTLLLPPYRTFVMPGSSYGFPEHLRLGAGGGGKEALAKGIERLNRFLDDHFVAATI